LEVALEKCIGVVDICVFVKNEREKERARARERERIGLGRVLKSV